MNGASGEWEEPPRGMLASVLSQISARAKEGFLSGQEEYGGPLGRTASGALLETLSAPMDEYSMGPSALMTRPQTYQRMIELFGEQLNKADLAQALKAFPSTAFERIKKENLLALTPKEMKSYGLDPGARAQYYPTRPELPSRIALNLEGKGMAGQGLNSIQLASYKGDPSIIIRKGIEEPIEALKHETVHEILDRLQQEDQRFIKYSKRPEEILATLMEKYPKDKSLVNLFRHLTTSGKDVRNLQETSRWVNSLEDMLRRVKDPPRSPMPDLSRVRTEEKLKKKKGR